MSDVYQIAKELHEAFPESNKEVLVKMLEGEQEILLAESGSKYRKVNFQPALVTAHRRMLDWLTNGTEYMLDAEHPLDVANFMASHRPACVYCVLIAKYRRLAKQD